MKTVWCLLLLFLAPQAGAETQLLEDDVGDHSLAGFEDTDLVALSGTLDADFLRLEFAVADLTAPAEVALVDSGYYDLYFQHGAAEYRLDLGRRMHARSNTEGPAHDSALLIATEGLGWRQLAEDLDFTEDTAGNSMAVLVPTFLLEDQDGLPLRPGSMLTDFWMTSYTDADGVVGIGVDTDRPTAHDRMPNAGLGSLALAMPVPDDAGFVVMNSALPTRSSNGGPMLLVYDVRVRNEAEVAQSLPLRVEGAPSQWSVRLVPEVVHLEPGEQSTAYVLVQTGGAHGHGADETFQVLTDGAAVDLTVHYPEIPQPAGHHDTVWFHARPPPSPNDPLAPVDEGVHTVRDAAGLPDTRAWMNTLEVDEADTGQRVPNNRYEDQSIDGWRIPLGPRLALGLVLTGETGEVTIPLQPSQDVDIDGISLRAVLRHEANGVRTDLAVGKPSPRTPLPAGVITEFLLPFEAEARVIPFQEGASLWLDVEIVAESSQVDPTFGSIVPMHMPGGKARLPLGEYTDPLPDALLAELQEAGVVDENGTIQEASTGGSGPGRDSPTGISVALGGLLVALAGVLGRRAGSSP